VGLTQAQKALITKARTSGGSALAVTLDDAICAFLVATIATDLDAVKHFPEFPPTLPAFFGSSKLHDLKLDKVDFQLAIDRLVQIRDDADTYFYCLATLHKARLKYERILQSQTLPTFDQVGPRGLLQYGTLTDQALVSLLFWRKWMFDLDNRAGQETGYVFEPIIAYALGGVPYSAKRSPITRGGSGVQGRQVDCVLGQKAYEIKIRVTIAASGQGRWSEELTFPQDCAASGYVPILVVLDPTANPKLQELRTAFAAAGGESYVGQAARDHLAAVAGPTMARFLEIYVHTPLRALMEATQEKLPDLTLRMNTKQIIMAVGQEQLTIVRRTGPEGSVLEDELPEDIDE
jgi:hypothetical protein